MTRVARRHTSPKGTVLARGEETRKSVLSSLPGTISEITTLSGLNYHTVKHAILQMVQRGELESIGLQSRPEGQGGLPLHIWGRTKPPVDTSNNPWYNAWYERAK